MTIFGAKGLEITGEWGKLHNAELHALFSSPNIIRNPKLRWGLEITVEWGKLHNAELHALFSSPDIIRNPKLRWGRRVIGISRSLIWSKTLMELIFNPCGEF